MKVPLLAEIPLDPKTREMGDSGKPIASLIEPDAQVAVFEKLARTIIERAAAAKHKARPRLPSLTNCPLVRRFAILSSNSTQCKAAEW